MPWIDASAYIEAIEDARDPRPSAPPTLHVRRNADCIWCHRAFTPSRTKTGTPSRICRTCLRGRMRAKALGLKTG